ncbi:MAG: electron transfer flavoprotein subunit alpha/FixB family protein [Actinobacteria bacterium]|jgi:electron transfer flavoprotein alpha subunit|nr:electron transfer flavoprotein subunit alpha/FixB family protein [Actinomycetota bacterium]MBT5655844.1 electron transfer flavoprotein subunit alpha/FixB family protein [Actinomycetota bacterium]MBT7013747.1 electron transfer flavoprotein subunit alpha/FixB family protein [Actinomycetota bacterium]MDA9675481.1 electron transfer flavoprotein subunit alpha/FixB family protein [Candidatus Actinomarina sp.]
MKSLIIGETSNGTISSGTLELISKITQEGLDFKLITIGSDENPKIGSDTFKNTYMKLNQNELSLASVANEISNIIKSESINLVLASSTYVGRDIAGFVSVDLNASPISNVVNFKIDGDNLSTTNSIDGGESDYLTNVTSEVKVLIIRPKSFEASEIELNNNYETVSIEKNNLSVAVQDIFIEEKTGPQLEDSKIVISAGRGMVDVENLKFIEELANKLNAAIGGTRAIVDAGWMPYSQQVGQTGKTVKPDVYIACGISGATQHQVGMKDSKFIIAINKDEEAPIFQIADLGVVGDTLSIIPKLIDSL